MIGMSLRPITKRGSLFVRVTSIVLLVSTAFSVNAADIEAGKSVFNQCAGCHAVGPDAAHRFGPQLNGVMSRGAGIAADYDYSAAMNTKVAAGLSWDNETLDAYLKSPMTDMPGTKMAYPGLQSEDDRVNVIAYLATINADGSVVGESTESTASESDASQAAAAPRELAIDVPIPSHGVLHLGRLATADEVNAWDIDIRPDGKGLPAGAGSVVTGGELYDVQCASCHGVFGEGEGRWPILAGGIDTMTEERPEKTVGSYWPYLSTVFDYVRRAMPFGNVRSLSDDDVYALTAYLLFLNDLVDESFVLSNENFTDIRLPNEENFIADNRHEESWFGGAEDVCMSNCIEGVATVTQRARVLDVTPDTENEGQESGGID
ncbi:c-type cytochrome [Granulosicoccus sp.]|nr:c-type cytochrome [Granulosicoccus sp.]MDB4223901.1 c-type cytochrome [Granulosicoccus sp.]